MKQWKIGLGVWLLACQLTALSAQETSKGIVFHDNEPWSEMLQLAKEQSKLIFMDCYTSWCGPCKALAKNVFTQEKVGEFFNSRFINVKYDMEKGDGKMLYARYKQNIIGFPTLLLIDANGKVLQQLAGYKEADELIEGIQNASEGKDLFTLQKAYAEGRRDLTFMKNYIDCLQAAFLRDSVKKVTSECLEQMDPKELDKDDVWEVYGSYVTDVDSKAFEYLVNNADRYQYRLHRNRDMINTQLGRGCHNALDRLFDIDASSEDKSVYPLSTDTLRAQKLLGYMARASLNSVNSYRMRMYIHTALLKGEYAKAWNTALLAQEMGITGFTSYRIHRYVRYLLTCVKDKDLLKSCLAELEKYRLGGEEKDFSYHMYRTMADLNEKLGHRKEAQALREKYEKEDAKKRKELEEYLNKND